MVILGAERYGTQSFGFVGSFVLLFTKYPLSVWVFPAFSVKGPEYICLATTTSSFYPWGMASPYSSSFLCS